MDFAGLHADRDRILTKHFTPGRSGKPISCVVLHYNDGDLSIDGCYDTWQTRPASAHYQVQSDGLVGQLVWDGNTAWHAGDWDANCRSIGIEHANRGDSLTDECIESGAHLVAAICVYYKLGRPQWGVNVFPHNHFSSTDCPGPLREGTSYHDRYMARAVEWYDAMASGSQPGPLPGGGPNEAAKQQNEWWDDALGDIRYTGPKMIRAMQAQRGTKEDGVLSGQSEYNRRVVQGQHRPPLLRRVLQGRLRPRALHPERRPRLRRQGRRRAVRPRHVRRLPDLAQEARLVPRQGGRPLRCQHVRRHGPRPQGRRVQVGPALRRVALERGVFRA